MKQLLILFAVLALIGCLPDDKFGLSPNKQIKEFEVPGQAGTSQIDQENLTIVIPVDEDFDVSAVAPSKITASNMARVVPMVDEAVDFSAPIEYRVTAEDGSEATYNVSLKRQVPEVQLPNSNFDMWFDAGGYPEPGDGSSSSVWSTAIKHLHW